MDFLKSLFYRKNVAEEEGEKKENREIKAPSARWLKTIYGAAVVVYLVKGMIFNNDANLALDNKLRDIGIKSQEILQHQTRLLQEIVSLSKLRSDAKLTPDEESRLKELEEKNAALKRTYWDCRKEQVEVILAHRESAFIKAAAIWGKLLNRIYGENIPWTVDPWYSRLCKEIGGCCGRECGCCLEPRATQLPGEPIYAHCTSECGCCLGYLNTP